MLSIIHVVLAILWQFNIKECSCLKDLNVTNVIQSQRYTLNETIHIAKAKPFYNETTVANFTFTIPIHARNFSVKFSQAEDEETQVDCFGLGKRIAMVLESIFKHKANGSDALDVRFFLSSRKQPRRVEVLLGEQFGLEWTDFKIERRTVVIVHGFLSYGQVEWISDLEEALLKWDDVNVVVIDWSASSNTWNYYKAAVNTKIVGYQISKFIEHITNATINNEGPNVNWGPLHLIGHSLGAHICGFAAKELKKIRNRWTVQRITGLDPAQPCFNGGSSIHLHKTDAPFVDVIHTNGRLLKKLGLGLPNAIGNVDFYPNGGQMQPGCEKETSIFDNVLPISKKMIQEAICSHGRSYIYFTESLMSAVNGNCSFWARRWNLTYRHFVHIMEKSCNEECTEMGIRAELYPQQGQFFVLTANNHPFCANSDVLEKVKKQLKQDFLNELDD